MIGARVFGFGGVLFALSATFTASAMDSEDPIGLDSGWWFADTGIGWDWGGGSGGKGWIPKEPEPCRACQVECGPNGEMWEPGTGCHRDSRCFQDIDNWNTALGLLDALIDCWDNKGDADITIAGSRITGMTCEIAGVKSAQSFPTTTACGLDALAF